MLATSRISTRRLPGGGSFGPYCERRCAASVDCQARPCRGGERWDRGVRCGGAEAGELLGLPAILSGRPYEVTAEVSEQARVNFIPRAAFLRFLNGHPEAVIQVAQLLTDSHYAGHEVIQSLGLSRSASEKLARFFLGWSANQAPGQNHLRIALTQEEIGEMVSVSRETVTRLLTAFKKNLLTVKGATVNICNRAALQCLAVT
jgi:CRP/FNR family transcriptional regulator, cyclic AMP receptor protein